MGVGGCVLEGCAGVGRCEVSVFDGVGDVCGCGTKDGEVVCVVVL